MECGPSDNYGTNGKSSSRLLDDEGILTHALSFLLPIQFASCSAFSADLSAWDVSNVYYMNSMVRVACGSCIGIVSL
jgi:surface protein